MVEHEEQTRVFYNVEIFARVEETRECKPKPVDHQRCGSSIAKMMRGGGGEVSVKEEGNGVGNDGLKEAEGKKQLIAGGGGLEFILLRLQLKSVQN